jgi:hypothetical protein
MPLRDHLRPPLDDQRPWDGFHATWPVTIVALLGHAHVRTTMIDKPVLNRAGRAVRSPLDRLGGAGESGAM